MRISYSGREHLDVETTDSTGGTLDITFDGGTTWHDMEVVDPTHARVLVAGPGATGNPPETIVLGPGRYPVSIRLTRGVESVIREVEEPLDVLVQDTGYVSAGVCYPSTTDWGCAPTDFAFNLDDALRSRVEAQAWTALRTLLGGQLALCPILARPCAARYATNLYYEAPVVGGRRFGPYIGADGLWRNGCGCTTSTACGCTGLSEVRLEGPVGRVVRVTIDGVQLDPTAYRIDNGDRLVRTDGGVWPASQDMALPPTEVGTFAVEYFRGSAPSILDDWAAGVLAYELALACEGSDECRLPANVVSVTRAGLTMQLSSGMFADGNTGIPELNTYIWSMNPHHLTQPSTVVSPETLGLAPRVQTWGR